MSTTVWDAKRHVDQGFVDVLARGQILAIDFTVSDGGARGSKPQLAYITGALCEQKTNLKEKHDLYHGSNGLGRFEGLKEGQLVVPIYDAIGVARRRRK